MCLWWKPNVPLNLEDEETIGQATTSLLVLVHKKNVPSIFFLPDKKKFYQFFYTYFILEAIEGLKIIILAIVRQGHLREYSSPCNSPIWGV